MNKEKVLQLISEAIDRGAYISIHDCSAPSKEVAHVQGEQAVEALGVNKAKVRQLDSTLFSVVAERGSIEFAYTYVEVRKVVV